MADRKFYRCNHCGNLITPLLDAGVTPLCCGEPMEILTANSVDAASEKHVPVITRNEDKKHKVHVEVGSAPHPMTPEHYIQWIALEVEGKVQFALLTPDSEPKSTFAVKDNSVPITAYEYCNLHGLWKAEA
jgi:superoxide reductase